MHKEVKKYVKNYDFLKNENIKNENFLDLQQQLCYFHYENNSYYKKIVDNIFGFDSIKKIKKGIINMPYIPVDLFKNYDLFSVKEVEIFKTLKSSGTTSNKPSKIFLDRDNANAQSISLSKIFTDFTSLNRPGMLVADSQNLIQDKRAFSARAAGVIGFSYLCKKPKFILDSEMNILISNIEKTLEDNKIENILLFGFTYIIWLHLLSKKLPSDIRKELNKKAVLLHGGGWKKLFSLNISKEEFKQKINECLGIDKCINYYGMVEQTGSIFMECEEGFLHTNPLCQVISRNKKTLKESKKDEIGIAQVISCLPTSYPGNSIITDDLILVKGIDNCRCGRKGIYFDILGRLNSSEPRGCSDTYSK